MKVNIYSYDEYDSMEEHNEYTFFTRAKYDPGNEVLIPRFNDWKKGCVCQKPLNPDQLYIKCDECNGWFHPNCCGIKDEDIEKINKFFCPFCVYRDERGKGRGMVSIGGRRRKRETGGRGVEAGDGRARREKNGEFFFVE